MGYNYCIFANSNYEIDDFIGIFSGDMTKNNNIDDNRKDNNSIYSTADKKYLIRANNQNFNLTRFINSAYYPGQDNQCNCKAY